MNPQRVAFKTLAVSLFLGIGSLVPATVHAVPVTGPGGNLYDVIPASSITWDAANAAALALGPGWHLATVTSATENAFIDGLRTGAGLGEVWLGGYQNPINETVPVDGWTWVNGEGVFTYTNWLGGEPNDNTGPGSEQYLGIGLGGSAQWNDEGALGNIGGYVVEKNVPEGGSLGLAFLLVMGGVFAAHGRRVNPRC